MDPAEHLALAVDLGTGGPKVGLVTLAGREAWSEHLRTETRHLPGGGAEQDAEEWWRLIAGAARRGLAAVDGRVVAVAVTGQWSSRVPTDESGRPVAPSVQWTDTRGRVHSQALIGGRLSGYRALRAAAWIRRAGGLPSPHGADALSHILHLERDRPDAAGARWLLEPVDHLTMRFTGRAAASPASMLSSWLMDVRRPGAPPAYDPRLVRMAGIDPRRLPPLVPTGDVVGEVRPDVARDLALPPGVKVVAGVPDLHAATLGSGATGLHEAHLSVSTSGWISCPLPRKKTDLRSAMATVPGLGDGRYLLGNSLDSAGVCLEWARATLFGEPVPPFEEILALAASAPPGSNGVLFAPWLSGTRSPADDRHARGGWHGLSLRSTRAEMVRAVLEGVAMHAAWLHRAVERFAGRKLDPVRMVGGGARSDLWCQIHADVLGRTVERVAVPENAVLRGAALLAGVSLGAVAREDVRALVAVDRTFAPDPAANEVYAPLARELPRLYRALRPAFARAAAGRAA